MSAKVYFIGAGPGDPELITLKGARLIREAGLVLYAGSLVPRRIVAMSGPDAEVVDSSGLNLDQTHALLKGAVEKGLNCARVHTGDPSLYGAVREQAALLEKDGIEYEIVPGVTSAFAAAAAACRSFTVPEANQTLILTRRAGRTPVPEGQSLKELAAHKAAMAVYLSASDPEGVERELLGAGLSPDTLVVIAHRLGWEGEKLTETTLGRLAETAREMELERQTVFLVLPGQDSDAKSRLYDENFSHGFRK